MSIWLILLALTLALAYMAFELIRTNSRVAALTDHLLELRAITAPPLMTQEIHDEIKRHIRARNTCCIR